MNSRVRVERVWVRRVLYMVLVACSCSCASRSRPDEPHEESERLAPVVRCEFHPDRQPGWALSGELMSAVVTFGDFECVTLANCDHVLFVPRSKGTGSSGGGIYAVSIDGSSAVSGEREPRFFENSIATDLRLGSRGDLLVLDQRHSRVVRLDGQTGRVELSIPLEGFPAHRWRAVSPDGSPWDDPRIEAELPPVSPRDIVHGGFNELFEGANPVPSISVDASSTTLTTP